MKRKFLTAAIAATAALMTVAAVPPPAGYEYLESTTDVFFHRAACGGSEDPDMHVSLIESVDGGDGCGTIGGVSQPLNTAFLAAGEPALFEDAFPGKGTFDLRLDGSRDLEGVITFGQFRGIGGNPATPGGGQTEVTVVIDGTIDGKYAFLGQTTASTIVTPATPEYEVPFSIDLDDDLHGEVLDTINVTLTVSGVAVNQDFMSYSGASKFTLPTLNLREIPAA